MLNPIEVGQVIEGKTILDVKHLPNPKDKHLRLVFTEYRGQFVSFLYNVEFSGFNFGRYADTREEGEKRFEEHCREYGIVPNMGNF